MCGIIGYVGSKQATPIVLSALKRLEYRGYDSAGVAVLTDSFKIIKDTGKMDEIMKRNDFSKLTGNIAIGHTRWATHGGVTHANAHPHLSNNGEIAVVHNGIVENYQELKGLLKDNGFSFYSETDTETIPNLIELHMRQGDGFVEAAKRAFQELDGSFAILAVHKNGTVVTTRRGAPLVLGVGDGEYFVASDIPAFLEHTKKVIYLADGDFATINGGPRVYNLLTGELVDRPIHSVDWNIEQAQKGAFEHYMLKEIVEQVQTVQSAIKQDRDLIEQLAKDIKEGYGTIFVACGSSYNACLAAEYVFSRIAKKHVNVVLASEFAEQEHFISDKTLVVAVSQSGETADVLEAVKAAKKRGCKVAAIVNVVGSTLHRVSDYSILMNAGPEISVLSTKSYTSQLAILTLIAYAFAGKLDEGKKALEYLWNTIYHLTSASARKYVLSLAEGLKSKQHLFLIGRGLQYATALEAALKIKEVSYIHAEGFSGGELKHGTIALIEKGTPCIVFVSKDNKKEILSNAMEIKARGGFIIGIAEENNEVFDFFIKVPDAGIENPIIQIIPVQLLAYQLAVLRGCDPDKPRNLAKSVTVK